MKYHRPSAAVWLFSGFAIFVIWAAVFEIDQSVRSQGQVIPGARTQIIQVADGGVLAKLLVKEGQHVAEGEVLAILERERAVAAYQESLVKLTAQKASLIRARAEIGGYDPEFGEAFTAFPNFVEQSLGYYRQRKKSLEESSLILGQRIAITEEVEAINEKLFLEGDTSRMEWLQSKRELAQLRGELVNLRNDYYQSAQEEATRLQAELASSGHQLDERQSVLDHTTLVSPVTGIVKYLSVTTLGGVLRAGDELLQISPTDDDMVIEAKVNPVDIGLLKVGLPVSVSLDAFDYSIYGTLTGHLSYISSDTLNEQVSGESLTYYRVNVLLDDDATVKNSRLAGVALKPGMTANVSIRTGTRTVLRYLIKPIQRGFQGALSEG
jgi:adhesin transport system membrane fusion protein